MSKIVIYFPYALKEAKSGSAVRPQKMLKAFRDYSKLCNYDLIEIYGDSKERKEKIKKLQLNIDPKEIMFCYMENSTLPFWLTDKDHFPRTPFLEIKLFRFLKSNNIPLGLFYRDIYWRFEEYALKGFKRLVMRSIYRKEHSVYKKYVDRFFLPSIEMNKYVGFPEKYTSNLPPAGENLIKSQESKPELNIIYVGGISEDYGLLELLEAMSLIYKVNKSVVLHLVCREEEYANYKVVFDLYKDESWLKIYHLFGEQLIEIYRNADIAVIPRRKSTYNDFAVPVKLFEYMSHGLPIISTNCEAQSKVIKNYSIGIVVEDTSEGIKEGIEFFLSESNRRKYSKNVESALLEKNMWRHRVEEIASVLMKNELNN